MKINLIVADFIYDKKWGVNIIGILKRIYLVVSIIYLINNISANCRGKIKYAGKINGEPAKWMYYEDYLKKLNKN